MVKLHKKQLYLTFVIAIFINSLLGYSTVATQPSSPTFSMAALTWNVGNKTAKDEIVSGLAEEIEKLGNPDILVVGTQEELAKNGEEFKDKLLQEFGIQRYTIAAQKSDTTTAGMHKTGKKIALTAGQITPISKTANLPQNRNTLAVFVKKGITLEDVTKRIDYPPGEKKANKSFILIEGNLKRDRVTLPISIASVHLDAKSDKIRRSHANSFFDNQKFTNTNKTYGEILEEAKRFHLIMGDFNERDYLMKDNTVVDRGYLTNFPAYGYDYSAKQERQTPVYGTYGFTKINDKTPVTLPDPRGRKHNAKGGYLDQIVITSGLSIDSPPEQYGAVISDQKEFKQTPKKKLFYAGSDHLPVLRSFTITMGNDDAAGNEIMVKNYIKRRLPDFSKEIADLTFLLQGETVKDIQSKADRLIFYDDKGSSDDFLKQLANLKSLTSSLPGKILWKKTDLQEFQGKIRTLKTKIEKSLDQQFLATVYNKITLCNKNRNRSLEQIDDPKAGIQWYIPNTLSQDTFEGYKKALDDLASDQISEESRVDETGKAPKKKGKLRSFLSKKKSAA